MTPATAGGWRMWIASIVMMVCSWLSYVDRQVLAVLSPTILGDTGMNAERYTLVVSAFSITYMLANPLWGSVLDFVGLRTGMLVAVTLWSLASASHAWVGHGTTAFLGFAIARAVLGLGEGATFPGGFRTALDSLPVNRQSRGMAIAYSGGSLGAILTPIMVAPIAANFGWRPVFLLTGALGAAWLVLWWIVARPPYLPRAVGRPAKIVWPNPFERRFWMIICGYALGAFALGPILYLTPLYLNRGLGLAQGDILKVLWVPPLGWETGYLFWGWVSDRYLVNEARPARVILLLILLGLPVGAVTFLRSELLVMLIFFLAMFAAGGFIVVFLRIAMRSYPAGQSSMVAGLGAGSWSALVALLLPLLGRWFDQQRYTETFLLVMLVPAIGASLWLWLTRTIRKPGCS